MPRSSTSTRSRSPTPPASCRTSRSPPRTSCSPSAPARARPSGVDFDERRVIDSDGVLHLELPVPKTMTIVGGGVIGVEYASMFAAMGIRVTLVDARDRLLPYVDREIAIALQYLLRKRNVTFRFGEEVVSVERKDDRVITHLHSGKQIASHTLLYATGRQGATDQLALEHAGLECRQARAADRRRRVPHRRPAHLRRRRRGRAARARRHRHGAGTDRGAGRVRRAGDAPVRPRPDRHLRDPGDLLRRPDRGAAHRGGDPLRRRRRLVPGAGQGDDDARGGRPAQDPRLTGGPAPARRARDRRPGDGPRPHRPGADGPRRRPGLPRLGRLQLPDAGRGLQGRRAWTR